MFLNRRALTDLHDPKPPASTAADEGGLSDQGVSMDVVAHREGKERGATTSASRDITQTVTTIFPFCWLDSM